jgi:rhodanese-related sulfurtransferase
VTGVQTCALPISFSHGPGERLDAGALHQVDRRAAEAAAGEPRAQARWLRPGQFHEEVELGATVPEKIPRAFVALEQRLSELPKVAVTQGARAEDHALDFPDDVERAVMLARGEAVLVDARPPELFQQKHIAEAVNIPAPLFDVIYPMKLGRTLKPEQTVLVYGRTISKRYDEDVTQRLLQRHDQVRILEGGVAAWEEKGFAVAP